jgi:hypothetical protein
MNWLLGKSKIKNSFIVLGALGFLICLLLVLHFTNSIQGEKWSVIISGLLTGLIVAAFQLVLSIREMEKLERYDAMGIEEVLSTRDDSEYYRLLLEEANEKVDVLGVTCKRFLDDFASTEENAPFKNKALLRALERGVVVRILVANRRFLESEDEQRFAPALTQLAALKGRFPQQLLYSHYEHTPTHSIVVVDHHYIVGPSFPKVSSRFSPAIHLRHGSKFSERYLEYFEREWEKWAAPIPTSG